MLELTYNTAQSDISLPEYGRVIQGYLQHAKTITDPRRRQKTVEAIVQMMQQINPAAIKNMEDYREKLWNHAFRIANYELDVTPPPGIVIHRKEDRPRAEHVPYPDPIKRFRHYGRGVQHLIQKAMEMPDGPKKEGFVEVIASYMKLACKTWNREHYVSDDVVKDDLEALSEGQLELHEGHSSLDLLAMSANRREQEQKRNQRNNRKQKQGGGNNNSGNGGGGGRNRGGYRKRKK